MLLSADASGVDPAGGGEGEQAVAGIGAEVVAEILVKGGEAWVVGLWSYGERQCLTKECLPVQRLFAGNLFLLAIGGEDLVEVVVYAIRGTDVGGVVGAVGGEESFEVARLGGFVFRASQGDKNEPAIGLKDAPELGERARNIEPVKGAAGCDDRDGAIGKAGGLGRAIAEIQERPLRSELRADRAHLSIGFNGYDRIAVGEKDLGEHPRARADVGDRPARLQAAPGPETIQNDRAGVA